MAMRDMTDQRTCDIVAQGVTLERLEGIQSDSWIFDDVDQSGIGSGGIQGSPKIAGGRRPGL